MIQVGDFILDELQERAVNAVRNELRAGKKRVLLVGPTGFGKTVLALAVESLCLEKGTRVGFITSGRTLILQKAASSERAGLNFSVLMNQSGYPDFDCMTDFAIVSKDTLKHREKRMLFSHPDLWIVDEADVAISPRWLEMLEKAQVVLGLTATPVTGKDQGLGFFYEAIVEAASYSQLIASGRLVDVPEGKMFSPYRPYLLGVSSSAGDYNSASLTERMDSPQIVGDVVNEWENHGEDRKTVAFCCNKAHTAHVADCFNARGIRAAYIVDDTSTEERADIFEETLNGTNQVIVNCQVLTRGWDMPAISCGILINPTKRARKYLQCVGRILRAHPGKTDAVLIDHSSNVWRHGWPTEDRIWTLDTDVCQEELQDEAENKKAPENFCTQCGALWRNGPDCPNPACNATRKSVVKSQPAMDVDGKLVAVTRKGIKERKPAESDPQKGWTGLLFAFGYTGKTYAQASAAFKSKFQQWPDAAGVHPLAKWHERNMKIRVLWPGYGPRKVREKQA